jgi:hypothetical protein
MEFLLSTIDKSRGGYIEFTNPRSYELIHADETVSASIHFNEVKYRGSNYADSCPTLVSFLGQARYSIAIYNRHADRNPEKANSPCVAIYFRDGVQEKSISIEAFVPEELFASAVLLRQKSTQIDFNVEISDENVLANLESKLIHSSKYLQNSDDKFSQNSVREILDKLGIAFLS